MQWSVWYLGRKLCCIRVEADSIQGAVAQAVIEGVDEYRIMAIINTQAEDLVHAHDQQNLFNSQ